MCFKKKITVQPEWTGRTISANVVGNYPGYENDLDGPVPDADELWKKVSSLWPDITHREFKDSNATAKRLLSEIREAANYVGEDGMLFFIMDICHAESATRNGNFRAMRKPPLRGIGYDRVLVFSAARDEEYASDSVFNGKPNGAWHYCLIRTLEKDITYIEWFNNAVTLLKKLGFKQNPVIEGPMELRLRKVFEGNVETIEVSGHGGQDDDDDGDEIDGKDEIIHMHDRGVRDDEIRKILDKIDKRIFAKNHKQKRKMELKSFKKGKGKKDWGDSWLPTVVSSIGFIFVLLQAFNVLSPEQAGESQPLVVNIITGIVMLIGVFVKQAPATE